MFSYLHTFYPSTGEETGKKNLQSKICRPSTARANKPNRASSLQSQCFYRQSLKVYFPCLKKKRQTNAVVCKVWWFHPYWYWNNSPIVPGQPLKHLVFSTPRKSKRRKKDMGRRELRKYCKGRKTSRWRDLQRLSELASFLKQFRTTWGLLYKTW